MKSNLNPLLRLLLPAVLLLGLLLGGTATAASKTEIDAEIRASLGKLYEEYPEARELVAQAKGLLVFPQVLKAGFILGGEFGEGALLLGGRPVQYYRTTGLSFGLQAGAQGKAQVIMFMNDEVLAKFRQSKGWEAGVDGSIAALEFGTGGTLNTRTVKAPIVGFVFDNRGLMVNASLAGSKFWRIEKQDPNAIAPAEPPAPPVAPGEPEPALAPVENSVALEN
ncbi:MAG: YSC84-related protein [Pseudomonadota bacterium]